MATTRLMMQRQARRLLGTFAPPAAATSASAAARGASPLLPLGADNAVVRWEGLPVERLQTEDPTSVPPLRFAMQRQVRRLLTTDASPAATAREGSPLPLPLLPVAAHKATLPSNDGAVQITGIDPLAAAQGLPPFGFGSKVPLPQISQMGTPGLLFGCDDNMGQHKAPLAVDALQFGWQPWSKLTLYGKDDWHDSEVMGLQMLGKPDENGPPAKDDSPPPPKDDLPPPPPPQDDPTPPRLVDDDGKGRAGGVPPSGGGSRGAGNWSGGFESYLLYKLTEMRREQREESWRQYEETCKLKKELEDFRRDTEDKITKTQLILSNTALKLIGSIILLLLGGAKLAFPYVKDYIEMVLGRELGELQLSQWREFFEDKKKP